MKNSLVLYIIAAALASQQIVAQQSPSPLTQAGTPQTAPCTAAPSPAPATRPNNSRPSIIDKWKKKINDEGVKLGQQTGVPMPTTDDIPLPTAKPTPCPPKAVVPAAPPASPQPAPVKLGSDMTVTLHCNPLTPSPQGGARQTTLTLPDPKDFAVPKATDFLADSVVPDTAAKTPCYLIKVDPKTGKSFVQQQ